MDEITEQLQQAISERYTLERELGRGGMAIVYLARDLKHDRAVAVKVLRPELGALLGAERFLREIKTVAGLQHPHILPLYDSGEAGGTLYYVMPFVSGESLSDRLRRERQLPIKEALRITREVADALHYAHAKEIVHRDIKPANILLSGTHAVVTDFGIARAIHASGGEQWETLTESGVALGTPAYMSPEQTAGERELDARSDIYSLGCVLFEMLTGEPPFSGPDGQVMLGRRFSDPPPSARAVRSEVPEVVDQALTVALASGPADRFGNALDFIDAIWGEREYVQHVTGRQRLRQGRGRRRKLTAGAAGVAAVLAVAAVVSVLASRGGGMQSLGNALFPGRTADSAALPPAPPAVSTPPAAATPVPSPPAAVTAAAPASRDTSSGTRGRARPAVERAPSPRPSRAAAPVRDDGTVRAVHDTARLALADSPAAADTPARPAEAPPPPPAVDSPSAEQREAEARAAIQAVIAAYTSAIESRDVSAIRRVYPALSDAQARDWQIFFGSVRNVSAALSMTQLRIDGNTAEARVSGSYRFENTSTRRIETQPAQFQASLRRDDGRWQISAIR